MLMLLVLGGEAARWLKGEALVLFEFMVTEHKEIQIKCLIEKRR